MPNPIPRLVFLRFAACALCLLGTPVHANELAAAEKPKPIDPAARMDDLPPAVIDDALAIGGEDIAARKVRTRMTVAVNVNGTGPYRFVVDSGADTSVVGERLANALKLPSGTPVLLNGITASSMVDRVRVDQLQVGPSSIYNLHLPVLKELHIGAEGMLGLDALVEQRLMLDFEKRAINVDDALSPAPRMDGEIVVTARLKRGQLILTEVKAGNTAVDAVVDTGSEITIGNTALRDKLFQRYHDDFETVQVVGVTGVVSDLQLVRVPELRLGSIRLRNVPIAFADIPPFQVFGISEKPSLLLGTDLMEVFRRISLDFRARKVRFQLRKCDQAQIRISSMPSGFARLSTDNASTCIR
ncbi:retroviral-like aspartic protease family protein [Tsuneonella sp. HG249]